MAKHESHKIGIFDSGVGGLSLLREAIASLPCQHFIYLADSAFAPYGDRSSEFIFERCCLLTRFLISKGVNFIVIACNTATVNVIEKLRACFPTITFVGIEPAIKPALIDKKNQNIAVWATESTLKSERLNDLLTLNNHQQRDVLLIPCIGLAELIESITVNEAQLNALLDQYLKPIFEHNIDTLVLACTHYPFVIDKINQRVSRHGHNKLTVIEPSFAVVKQLKRLLLANQCTLGQGRGDLEVYSSGNLTQVEEVMSCLLKQQIAVLRLPDDKESP